MNRKINILLLSLLLAQGVAGAQVSMSVPNGSFEQWTSHPGYSVTALFVPVQVYNAFSTPTGWDYLSYPVNETYSMMGFNVNVNTDLPLIVASQDTGAVPDGSSAVKLQTFMLSDIVSSTVYSMASGSLDTTLTNTVYPSILSTGAVDMEHFIPMMGTLVANMDSIEVLLASMLDIDVNYLVTGGIALGSFEPTRLTGSYRYHSAVGGDNGGVLLLGTRYNSTLGRREVVGGGVNIALTDCTEYTPFTVDYLPISAYDATRPLQTPDSLVVMLISSASLNRQQGSWLCVDSLVLWHDACPDTVEVVAVPDTHSVALSWSVSDPVEGFELRYFPWTAFEPEETTVTLTGNSFTLTGLEAGRLYEAAIRTVCSSGRYGEWNWFQFSTLADTCARITSITVDSGNVAFSSDHMVTGYVATWTSSFEPEKWVVHCSMDGLMLNDTVYAPTFAFPPLPQDQLCFFQVRAACHDSILGVANSVMFTTLADTTSPVGILLGADHGLLSVWPNPAKDRLTVESPVKQVTAVEVYDVHWRLLIEGLSNTVDLSGLPSGVYFLRVKTADGRSAFARFIKE